MKNLFIILLVVLAAGCTQDTSELKNNVLKAYNSDAPQGAKATDLMIIQKKGNEYVGLLTTENDMQLMLSVFSDGKEFFYWVTNGAMNPGTQQMQGVAEEEVSMENFPEELIGDWAADCDSETVAGEDRLIIDKSSSSIDIIFSHGYGTITEIKKLDDKYVLNWSGDIQGYTTSGTETLSIKNGVLIDEAGNKRYPCNPN